MGIFDKGVKKTNLNFFQKLGRAIVGKSKVDDDVLDALEEALLSSDMGVDTTLKVIENLEDRVEKDKYVSMDELVDLIRDEIGKLLNVDGDDAPVQPFDFSKKPYVMLVVGVNGVGKTTTIGKLASMLTAQGKKVVIGAADTFRAAAVEQLTIWAERAGVDIVKQAMGADPASVAFDTVKSAVAKEADVVLIDTAGRLHNRIDLMNELTKIRNVIRRVVPDGPPTGRTRSCSSWTAPPARTRSCRRRSSPAPRTSRPSPSRSWTAAPRAAWSWASWTSSGSPSSSSASGRGSTT